MIFRRTIFTGNSQQGFQVCPFAAGHGLFTHALLRGLRGEAKSAQGEVTAHSLYEFIDHEVANVRQQPVFFGETTGRIVLMHYRDRAKTTRPKSGKKSPTSRPTSTSCKIKGTWVMLGDNFLVAQRVCNHSDGSIELAVTPQTGEHEAAIAALRPTQFGGYVPSWNAAYKFRDFLKEHGLDPENEPIVVAGKNYASFDARFLSKLTGWSENIKVHHRVLDPALLYWQPEIDGVVLPDTKTCMERAGISGEVAHTAVEDAQVVVRLIRQAITLRQTAATDNTSLLH